MANQSLFSFFRGKAAPRANTVNEAGGVAYQRSAKQALAQLVSTGCFNATFYADAREQLERVLALCQEVEPEFIARAALHARQEGAMKDMPALLCAVLSVRSPGLLAEVFDRVINNAKMLRNFVQMMRSGVTGRKSLGTLPRRLIRNWLANRTEERLFTGSVGQSPSLADIVKLVHPKPATQERQAFYRYLLGHEHQAEHLPGLVRDFEAFKAATDRDSLELPPVPMEMLTALRLSDRQWYQIAANANWQATRMNLNTFARHGVFQDATMVRLIAARLRNPELIAQARPMPYQLLVAYQNARSDLPAPLREALHDAMEISAASVPTVDGKVFVCPDVSGSMRSPLTGHRKGSTTQVRCIDVAALIAAAILRKNPDSRVIPFEEDVVHLKLKPFDKILSNAEKLAAVGGGGTNCSAPLRRLNQEKSKGDLVITVSDNQSWIDTQVPVGQAPTETMAQWQVFKLRNPRSRMICIDLQPYATTQAVERDDIIHVGGFSDQVFSLIAQVASGAHAKDHWVKTIEAISI